MREAREPCGRRAGQKRSRRVAQAKPSARKVSWIIFLLINLQHLHDGHVQLRSHGGTAGNGLL